MIQRLPEDHPDALASLANAAIGMSDTGELQEALRLHEKSIQLHAARFGKSHPSTLRARSDLANCYITASKPKEALEAVEGFLDTTLASLAPEDRITLEIRNTIGLAYEANGKVDEALRLWEENAELAKQKLGLKNFRAQTFTSNLAHAYQKQGEFTKARKIFESLMELHHETPEHPSALTALHNLAWSASQTGELDQALEWAQESVRLRSEVLGANATRTLTSMNVLGRIHLLRGELDEAVRLLEQIPKLAEGIDADHVVLRRTRRDLVTAYREQGEFEESVELLQEVYALEQVDPGPTHPDTLQTMDELGESLLAAGQLADAERVLRKCAAHRREHDQQLWRRYSTGSILARVMVLEGMTKEAETILIQAFEGMEADRDRIPFQFRPRLRLTAEALQQLYASKGDEANTERWQSNMSDLSEWLEPADAIP